MGLQLQIERNLNPELTISDYAATGSGNYKSIV